MKLISVFQGKRKNREMCAGQDLNLHPIKLGYAPQTYASTNSATSAFVFNMSVIFYFDDAKI